MISDTLVSIRTGGEVEPAGAARLYNIMVLPTVPSIRHGSCGPRSSTVPPRMLTETPAFSSVLPVSDRSVPLAGQLTCKSCLVLHPGRLSDESVP